MRRSGALANGVLVTIFPALFHTARTLSGSLRSPPSPTRGRLWFWDSAILVSPPSPLWKGDRAAVDRVLSYIVDLRRISPLVFHAARTLSGSLRSPPSPRGEGFVSEIAVFSYRSLPHGGRGTASVVNRVLSFILDLRRISLVLFHTASTLSGSLRSPPSPRGEGFVRRYCFSSHIRIFALTM